MKRFIASLLFVLTLLWGHSNALGKEPIGDLAMLHGRWKAWTAPEQFLIFEVTGNSFTLSHYSGDKAADPWNGSLAIDEFANPKRLTWTHVKGGGRDIADNQCIYEIHGETLLLIGGGATAPPEHFYSGGAKGNQTLIFKRQIAD